MDTGTPQDDTFRSVEIVARIAAGDPQAEAALVRHYSRVVYYTLRRRLRDDATAHDLHQETFIAVLRRLRAGGLETAEALPGYVRQVALNLATSVDRKEQRQQTFCDDETIGRMADASRSALDELEETETVDLMRRSIDELTTPRDRDLLKRYFVAEQEKHRICDELGLSAEHFDRVLHRAKKRLAEIVTQVFAHAEGRSR